MIFLKYIRSIPFTYHNKPMNWYY